MHVSESGGRAGRTFFLASVVRYFRSGGATRSGFRWIPTLGGGAFGIRMSACRKGKHTEVLFLLAPYDFPRPGGGRFFRGVSTISGGTFSGYMPEGREGKLAEPFSFALSPLIFHGAWG